MGDRDLLMILHSIRQTAAEVGGVSDGQLLERFVSNQDEAAFELLLWRHARLVFGVCQRVLHDIHDAEDAFQATVLILARRAGRIHKRDAVASWLYKVAYRTALTLRAKRAQRVSRERPIIDGQEFPAPPSMSTPTEQAELQEVLDQEVSRLPERYRAPVVLCYCEGRTLEEAAVQIGCPRGTIASRLARGRERLRLRLARRGLALTAGLVLLEQAGAAPRPLSLLSTLIPAVVRSTTSAAVAHGGLSRNAVGLTHEVLRAMFWHKLKTSVAIILAFAGILAGGGLAVHLRANAGAQAQPVATDETPKAQVATPEREKEKRNAADAALSVKVMQPVRREFTPHEAFVGRLEAMQTVEVRARVSGQLEKISFKAGAEVKKGDVLFEIDPRVYRVALDKAEAELTAAGARRQLSEADFTRARKLQEAERIAQGDYDQIKSQATTADANWKVAKATLDHAKLNLEATKIKAPVDGVIGQPRVDLGNHVMEEGGRSLLLATITSLEPMRLSFDMDERSFLRYRRMMREGEVRGPGSALVMRPSDEDTFSRKGTLDSFDVQIDPKTGTLRARGIFPNPDRMLFPGMSAAVRMPVGKPRNVLEVPAKAVLSTGTPKRAHTVLVVTDRDLLEERAVEVGQEDTDNMIVIEKGLSEGDWVVADFLLTLDSYQKQLRDGNRVKPERLAKPSTPAPAKK